MREQAAIRNLPVKLNEEELAAKVVQEPAQEDLLRWTEAAGGAVDDGPAECEIRFPNGVVVNLDDKEAAEREMETFIRGAFGW